MPDPSTTSFTLAYLGTLTVAAVMVIGQVASLVLLLSLVGTMRLLVHCWRAATASSTAPD